MACLNKEGVKYYRIHWKFKVTVGPKAVSLPKMPSGPFAARKIEVARR